MKDCFDTVRSGVVDREHEGPRGAVCITNDAMIDILKSASLGAKALRERELEHSIDFRKHNFDDLYSRNRAESCIGKGAVGGSLGSADDAESIGKRAKQGNDDCKGAAVCEEPSSHIDFGKGDEIYSGGIGSRAIPSLNPENGGIWKHKTSDDNRDPICHAWEIPEQFVDSHRR